jgi:four helix bundle protein
MHIGVLNIPVFSTIVVSFQGRASLICSLMNQIRRSSRSVCASIAEAWRRRRYEGFFIYRLNDAEAEAAETQTWIEFAVKCGYLETTVARSLYRLYDRILGKLVVMIRHPEKWVIGYRRTN